MSQSMPETDPAPKGSAMNAADALPPVEPPSAKFLVQLFVIPAIIVGLIVLVWLAVTWLASGGDDPKQYIDALQRSGPTRFQSASNLATALADQKHDAFKKDPVAAQEVATLLDKEIDMASMEEQDVTLRHFLCKALGEFYVDDGLPVLLRAAKTQREDVEVYVQRAAIESIAVLAGHLQEQKPPQTLQHEDLDQTLLTLSQDDDPTIRYTAAVALGAIGRPSYVDRLKEMLRDANIDVRYNAALGLAKLGDEESIPTLLMMLEPGQEESLENEKVAAAQDFKRINVLTNGMRAAIVLHNKNPDANMSEIIAAIEKLEETSPDERIRLNAKSALIELTGQPKQTASAN